MPVAVFSHTNYPFALSIACEIANGGKRQLVIRAGKSHKFTIPEDEVPR